MFKKSIISGILSLPFLLSAHAMTDTGERIDCLKSSQQDFFLFNSDVESLIASIAATCDAAATVRLRGSQNMRTGMNSGTPLGLLEELGSKHNFMWHFDGYEVHIHPKKNVKSKLVAAKGMSPRQLHARLDELGWLASHESIQATKDGKILRINGTDAFVGFVEDVLDIKSPDDQLKPVKVYRSGRLENVSF